MKSIKYLYHVLIIKDNGIHTLAYFYKDLKKQIFTKKTSYRFSQKRKD